jgi:hypothetical protein
VMMPYVGGNYESSSHAKMLLLGESFFFPDESTIHHVPEAWYQLNEESLNGDECQYADSRDLLPRLGHKMYAEISACLDTLGLAGNEGSISHVAYTNAFMRPAVGEGESFEKCSTPLDCGKSREITAQLIRVLKPDVVVYLSKYAWGASGKFVADEISEVNFESVCHPLSMGGHWTAAEYTDGRAKFIEILKEAFLRSTRN